MFARHLFLLIVSLVLVSADANPGGAGHVISNEPPRLYLPVVASQEVPLSQITGVGYLSYNWYMGPGEDVELCSVRADGSHLIRLTDNDRNDRYPSWSHDGAFIAWMQSDWPSNANPEAWIMDADGSHASRIGNLAGTSPGPWSPVENRLLVRQHDPSKPEGQRMALYLVTPPAAPVLLIAATELGSFGWSPTGEYLFFETAAPNSTSNLYLAHPDGSEIRLFANLYPGGVSWSPDGLWLAYRRGVSSEWDVYVSHADGSEQRAIHTSASSEVPGPWLPDSSAFFVTHVLQSAGYISDVDLYSMTTGSAVPFLSLDPPHRYTVLGVSPEGRSAVYLDRSQSDSERYAELKLRMIGSLATTSISESIQALGVQFGFAGWSADARQVAYSANSPSLVSHYTYRSLYVANVDGAAPVYRLLEGRAGDPMWLPGSSWLSGDRDSEGATLYYGTRLYNPRSGEHFDLPWVDEHRSLIVVSWCCTP